MSAVIIAQFISTLVIVGVQCIPVQKYWIPTTPGHCISITAFFYCKLLCQQPQTKYLPLTLPATNVFTIVTDLIILALPLSTVWHIQRPRPEKIGILAVFLAGGLSTISSIVRLYSVRIYTQSHAPMHDAAPINTWSFIEINMGIICASAPGKHIPNTP
jgi:hypothetical protein